MIVHGMVDVRYETANSKRLVTYLSFCTDLFLLYVVIVIIPITYLYYSGAEALLIDRSNVPSHTYRSSFLLGTLLAHLKITELTESTCVITSPLHLHLADELNLNTPAEKPMLIL